MRAVRAAGCLASAVVLALGACASRPPAPDWQVSAKTASERAVAAYLTGNARVDAAESARARSAVASTGRADLLARVELAHCAAQVASLVFEPCAGFEALRADAAAPERAYADFLAASAAPANGAAPGSATANPVPSDAGFANAAMLPEPYRAIAAGAGAGGAPDIAALKAIADPLSRLIASGVLLRSGRADGRVVEQAIETASAQGWRRPLLAWLGVQLKRAQESGTPDDVQRLQRRIALVLQAG